MEGKIVDASIIQVPRRKMTKEEKQTVKVGEIPETWKDKPANLSQKAQDARWIVKESKAKGDEGAVDFRIPYFGYMNHLSCDRRFGFVRRYEVTAANRSDGSVLPKILDVGNMAQDIWGNTAYHTQTNKLHLDERGFRSQLHHKKPNRKAMPKHIRQGNTTRSKIRSKVEHIFAGEKHRMGLFIQTIGICRARVKIGLANPVYNFTRLSFWERKRAFTG